MNNFVKIKFALQKFLSKFTIYKILPLIWPLISNLLKLFTLQSKFIPPGSMYFDSALLLTNKKGIKLYQGINLTEAAKGYLETYHGIKNVNIKSEFTYGKEDIIIISTNFSNIKTII
jgi:hypothetical protein